MKLFLTSEEYVSLSSSSFEQRRTSRPYTTINFTDEFRNVSVALRWRKWAPCLRLASDEARSGVQYGLQTPNSVRRSAVQDHVAVVHLAVNQRVDESMQRVEGERPSDRT